MATRFISNDHDTPMPLPPHLRAWVAKNHLVLEVVGVLDLSGSQVDQIGSGSEHYPPEIMLRQI